MMDKQHNSEFYSAFFRDSYLQSGWIPVHPFGQSIANGDVFQLHQHQLLPLLNIQQLDLTHQEKYSETVALREQDWPETSACVQTHNNGYNEETPSGISQFRQQHYAFHERGAYLFKGKNPSGRFMLNWHHIAEELIVKLTQSKFTFQEVYVVTDIAEIPHWGLAIAARENAELRLMSETNNSNCLFESEHCQMNDSSYLSFYEHSHFRPLYFFRAKKLRLSAKKYDEYLVELLNSKGVVSQPFHKNWLQTSLLKMASSNELNISTCMDFFEWQEVGLDDVVKMVGY